MKDCLFCKMNHKSYNCPNVKPIELKKYFIKLNMEDRKKAYNKCIWKEQYTLEEILNWKE